MLSRSELAPIGRDSGRDRAEAAMEMGRFLPGPSISVAAPTDEFLADSGRRPLCPLCLCGKDLRVLSGAVAISAPSVA